MPRTRNGCVSSGMFPATFVYFLWMGCIFLFLCMPCDFCCFSWKLLIYRNSHLFHSLYTAFVLRKSLLISWVLVLSLRLNLGRNLKSLFRAFLSSILPELMCGFFNFPLYVLLLNVLITLWKSPWGLWWSIVCLYPEKGKKFFLATLFSIPHFHIYGHHIYGQSSAVSNSDTNSLKLVPALQSKDTAPQD